MIGTRKLLIKEGGIVTLAAVLIFSIFFIWIAVGMLDFAPAWFSLMFIATPVLFVLFVIFRGMSVLTGNRKASILFSNSEISDSEITFPAELEYEVGRLLLEGYWSYSTMNTGTGVTNSRSYRTRRSFTPEMKSRGLKAEFPRGPFRVELRGDGTGTIEAPAIRILEGPYRDVLIILLTDEGEVEGEGSITLVKGSDTAQISFRGDGRFVEGSVWAGLSKSRRVRVEYGSNGMWRTVAEGRNEFSFRFSTLPEEKIVIFSHYSSVSPRSILRKLWKGPVILGHGSFELRGVLDVPLGRDVSDTAIFKVNLREK